MKPGRNANTYKQLGAEFSAQEASPEQLILMLLEKACENLRSLTLMPLSEAEEMELQAKIDMLTIYHQNSGKVLQILSTLQDILDFEKGGELAYQLKDTYGIILRALWKAVKEKNIGEIEKLLQAINELRVAWETVVANQQKMELSVSAG